MKLFGIISISIFLSLVKDSYEVIPEDQWKVDNRKVVSAENCHFNGDPEISSIENKNNKCGPICQNHVACTHWYYDGTQCHLLKGRAFLGRETDNDALATTSTCGFNPNYCNSVVMCKRQKVNDWKFKNKWLYAIGCDFADKDIKTVDNVNNNCGPACDKEKDCTHWTFIQKRRGKGKGGKEGVCHLKKGKVDIHKAIFLEIDDFQQQLCGFSNKTCPTKEKCLTEVVKDDWTETSVAATGFVVAPGCDFKTRDFKVITLKSTSDDCGQYCDNENTNAGKTVCTHFTFKGSRCFLKNDLDITINDAIAGNETDVAKQYCGFSTSVCPVTGTQLTDCTDRGNNV